MKFDTELFKNPTAEYRGYPFWSWNTKLSKSVIKEQLEIFKEMGMGGVVIHPREGLDTEYMGNEFLDIVKYTTDMCVEMGLVCWLYDDDRFPSGAADGLVTKNPRYRARQIRLTKNKLDNYCKDYNEFQMRIKNGEIPIGYYLTAYSLDFCDNGLKAYRELKTNTQINTAIANGENIRYAYVELAEEEEWFNGQTYIDTMNPEAVDEFINITHEQYKKALGNNFKNGVSAIFTDEPRLGKQGPLDSIASDKDVFVPYTEYFGEWFKNEYGIDALSILPEYVWDMSNGDRKNRYLYRNGVCECFSNVFMDRISHWCNKNGIKMTGHILGEENLLAQTTMVGSAMRTYKEMDIPGVDLLIDGKELSTVKQASSVSEQYGKIGTMSEEYGGTQWDCTFKTYKLQGDWQAALGITYRVHHLSHMTTEGEGKRDWPASIFYQSPWYREYGYIEDHFARLNTVLRQGKRITKTAVLHPVESYWLLYGTDKETKERRKKLENSFQSVTKWLLFGLVDFDYLCESMLCEQCRDYQGGALLKVGKSEYERVIVPDMVTIRSTTLKILEKFARTGKEIVFAGGIPEYVDGIKSDRAKILAKKCEQIKVTREEVLNSVEDIRDIKITCNDGRLSDNLLYQLRQVGDSKWLFICHVNDTGEEKEEYNLKIKGNCKLTLYDTVTGDISYINSVKNNGYTDAKLTCYSQDSFLIRLDNEYYSKEEYAPKTEFKAAQKINRISEFSRTEKNVLVLDYARAVLDNDKTYGRDEILRLDNKLRKDMGFFIRDGRNRQPWATDKGEEHSIRLIYEFTSNIEAEAFLGIEKPYGSKITLNGINVDNTEYGWYIDKSIKVLKLPPIKSGENVLEIQMPYNQKTQLESIYILGDFGVELQGNTATVVEDTKKLDFGSITNQGMPFYTGNVKYKFSVDIKEMGEYCLRVPSFKSPLLEVSLDGKRQGLIAFAPHRVDLGELKKGENSIEITLFGNRQNVFGTLHNADDNYTWYGNGAYRTTGWQWTDSYKIRETGIMSEIVIERPI